jgi:hypothetical protein
MDRGTEETTTSCNETKQSGLTDSTRLEEDFTIPQVHDLASSVEMFCVIMGAMP